MMKFLLYTFVTISLLNCTTIKAQQVFSKDSVVQLYGVVMTADSLRGIPAASVIVLNKGRGTITNNEGIFSIVVLKGDRITFSSIGYKDITVDIPKSLQGNELNVIQLLVSDTNYLPATILKPRPTREQFERDFASTRIADDSYEIARQNLDEQKRRALLASMPADGREAVSYQLRQQANKYYYSGQLPPMNIFNPAAWADFIQAWKRGDFKKKN